MKQKVNYTRHLHPDDNTSTFLMVKKLQQEDFNIILVYKPQGEKMLIGPKMCNNIDLKNNIFVFGFKTKEKLKMFEKPAHEIVCIDGTYKTNQCKFLLINLVIPDEFNKGYPVAHLICNRKDKLLLIPFFQAIIKDRSSNPNLEINAVMTEDDSSRWNTFSLEIAPSYCANWHVKRAWGNKKTLCGSQQLQKKYTRHRKLS